MIAFNAGRVACCFHASRVCGHDSIPAAALYAASASLRTYGGPYLFGKHACAADAMYAPVCSRFVTYDVALSDGALDYCRTMMRHPYVQEWIAAAKLEPDELEELDVEF